MSSTGEPAALLLRSYAPADRAACLAIFDGNTPRYFGVRERDEFAAFLDAPTCTYFVVVLDGSVVACGGYYVNSERREAGLCWGMVEIARQRTGIGRFLLLSRLVMLCDTAVADVVRLDTSQHSQGFFERLGFVADSVTRDGFGAGIDRVAMHLILTRGHCRALRDFLV